MIRNVVLARLPDDADQDAVARLEEGLAGIRALRLPGLIAVEAGRDVGLRAGGWSAAIVNDWVDEDAYRAYDVDAEHQVYRELVVGACVEVARVQLRLDDPTPVTR